LALSGQWRSLSGQRRGRLNLRRSGRRNGRRSLGFHDGFHFRHRWRRGRLSGSGTRGRRLQKRLQRFQPVAIDIAGGRGGCGVRIRRRLIDEIADGVGRVSGVLIGVLNPGIVQIFPGQIIRLNRDCRQTAGQNARQTQDQPPQRTHRTRPFPRLD
jgi:hypothetical protein